VTFDCGNAAELAAFWAAALRWDVSPGATSTFASVGGPNRPQGAPALLFFAVDEPKIAKNRNHVDLHTNDLDGELTRLVGLGATVLWEKHEYDTHWHTLVDPAGNEFCLVQDDHAPP
jgi:predicted enzyme related to lactoylglutathione lyase